MLEHQNNTYEIFLASRFEEFKEIRTKLREKINQYKFMKTIDLNNNEASLKSPLDESLFYAKKSEIMILLVGETYGTIPEGEEFSYTHLEYKEAIKDNSNTRVLVFCIGSKYKNIIEYSDDKNMANWQKELEKNHRLKKFTNQNNIEEVVEQIFVDLLSSLYELNLIKDEDLNLNTSDLKILENNIDDEFLSEDNDSLFLDMQYQEDEEVKLLAVDDEKVEGFELLKIPNKLASLEQKKEAQYAIDIRDYSTAVKHLQKALELKPLDFETNYWLAKLYITSAKKSLFYEIEDCLLRAAKIAEKNNKIYMTSHCYLLIVQASIFSDKKHEGEKYIKLAEENTKTFAKLYYEKAKFLFSFGENIMAKQAIDECLKIKMDFLEQINNDPFFITYKKELDEHFKEMKNKLYKTTEAILYNTNNIRNIFDIKKIDINIVDNSMMELWKNARNGIMGQYRLISKKFESLNEQSLDKFEDRKNELGINLDRELKNIDKNFERIIEKISIEESKETEKTESETNTKISIEKDFLLIFSSIFIIVVTILFFSNLHYGASILSIVFGTFIVYKKISKIFKIKKNKILKLKTISEISDNQRNENIIERDNQKKYFENKFNESLELINNEIIEYKNDIIKFKKALEIFEGKSLTLSEAKFIPFRSLNKARFGTIIRVHKYNRKLDENIEIEVLEDFQDNYNIESIYDENNNMKNSFLAKVISKTKDKMVLSRSEAYFSNNNNKIKKTSQYLVNNKAQLSAFNGDSNGRYL
ncbi:DUF4062 domain-containing protein [Aliarcobacter butzleri]|uniref:DUF4062 domain-containing protein n=1 Tax=Aliarcobacter butzleri TaxID=28197 RepID=UPI00065A7F3F|nr:DUF4062 domain-containing protein [Aliarcobacter butzleri]KLE05363.1 hypothetical protein AF78_05450 [Aliarcobacter butzleri L353]MCT7565131.1 DUF4062 domain-containing protein [Aliarcobacter butzleri]MCT7571215.1 DUF4062 domain-containing protein [Aliarcobacter butzleri]